MSKLSINVTVDIENIGKIDVVNGVIEIMYKLTRDWFDSRLVFQNLKTNNQLNKISLEETKEYWYPIFKFTNMYSPQSYQQDDLLMNWTIIQNSSYKYSKSGKEENKNVYFFDGSENYIEFTKLFSTIFNCDYDLSRYPFDTQVC